MSIRIRVYDSRIDRINFPGGDVYSHMSRIRHDAETRAKATCPRRTGRLMASISSGISGNQFGTYVHLKASAHYANWVEQGTTGPIVARTAPYMKFRGWGPWAGGNQRDGFWRLSVVRGQRANPFLHNAAEDALRDAGIR